MSTFYADRQDLAWALKAIQPHVARGDVLPALEGLRLEVAVATRTLYVVGTDRYTLGVARVPITGDDLEPAETAIDITACREMIRRLRGKGATGLIIWDDGEVTLDLRVRYPPAPGAAHFPDWRALLGRYLRYSAGMPGKSWAYNTEYLGRFAAARRDNTALAVVPLRIPSPYGHAPGSATVVLGPDFAGAVMGVRNDGDGDAPETLRRWRELIPEGSKP